MAMLSLKLSRKVCPLWSPTLTASSHSAISSLLPVLPTHPIPPPPPTPLNPFQPHPFIGAAPTHFMSPLSLTVRHPLPLPYPTLTSAYCPCPPATLTPGFQSRPLGDHAQIWQCVSWQKARHAFMTAISATVWYRLTPLKADGEVEGFRADRRWEGLKRCWKSGGSKMRVI